MSDPIDPVDRATVEAQLGRSPRAMIEVAHRCGCGLPDVVTTSPRLPDGTPFPTTFYLTCPRLASAISTLEADGVMRDMQERLAVDPALADRYRSSHYDYLARRARLGHVEEIEAVSAGGMPDRVKCLHALVAHALAAGPGVNPFGDEALSLLLARGVDRTTPCASRASTAALDGAGERVAAIDCGTNSIRLLVADLEPEVRLVEVERRMEIVRLGQGVDRTGQIDPAALARTLAAVDRYAARIRELGASRIRFAATSATRDASNRDAFIRGVVERLAVMPEVVTGDEEAALSFTGALQGLVGIKAPALVFDIGGGSTEFVIGDDQPGASRSVNIGCVRMAERHFHHDPPLPSEVRAARDDIDIAIREVAETVALRSAATMVGVAGTVTTVAAMALGLDQYDADRIHGSVIDAADVHRIAERLLYLPRQERAAIPVMHPGRVDVIAAGALVLSAVMAYAGAASLVVSEHDLLDGLALSLLSS
ncbi:MAG: DUF501 domain-containing protein [Actinomycetes bacterium]